mmetsp:Transcript_16507/g.41189  ORF Transcript_16507/g.41189 Transcript_16507/m.41189 type:complete len:225 (+) Transcript_16507:1080-1754(+)
MIRPEPGHTHTSLMSPSAGSMDVKPAPLDASHTLMMCLSDEMTRLLAPMPSPGALWNLMSLMGAPYMWSLTSSGCCARRSYSATRPVEVPTATCSPASSNRTHVSSEPGALQAAAALRQPTEVRARGSKHSSCPSSPAAATRPCTGLMPSALTAGERHGSGAMNRPSSRLSRHTSGADPATSSSAANGAYARSRPKRGTRVLWYEPKRAWKHTVRSVHRNTALL